MTPFVLFFFKLWLSSRIVVPPLYFFPLLPLFLPSLCRTFVMRKPDVPFSPSFDDLFSLRLFLPATPFFVTCLAYYTRMPLHFLSSGFHSFFFFAGEETLLSSFLPFPFFLKDIFFPIMVSFFALLFFIRSDRANNVLLCVPPLPMNRLHFLDTCPFFPLSPSFW